MKNLRKIIGLFLLIFIAGIAVTVVSINTTLNKNELQKSTIEKQKDSLDLVKAKKHIVKSSSNSGTTGTSSFY